MNPKTKELYMYILGGFIVGVGAMIVVLLIFYKLPDTNKDIVNIALGTVLGMAVTVVSYFFGSSKSSADKTELLNIGKQSSDKTSSDKA